MLQKCACGITAVKLWEKGKIRVVASEIIIASFGTILKCSRQVFLEVSACLLKLCGGIKSRNRMRKSHPAGLHGGQREMNSKAEQLTGQQACYRAADLLQGSRLAPFERPSGGTGGEQNSERDRGRGFGNRSIRYQHCKPLEAAHIGGGRVCPAVERELA